MIKVLVVTYRDKCDMVALHSIVIEFNTDAEADEACQRIHRKSIGSPLHQVAIKLNGQPEFKE